MKNTGCAFLIKEKMQVFSGYAQQTYCWEQG